MEEIKRVLKGFKQYEITYQGPAASLNDVYGSNNWRVRKGIVDKYKTVFLWLLKAAKVPKFDKFALFIFYNSRHDADNITGAMGKIFMDSLKTEWVEDDSPRYCKGVSSFIDPSLEHNTFKFVIIQC